MLQTPKPSPEISTQSGTDLLAEASTQQILDSLCTAVPASQQLKFTDFWKITRPYFKQNAVFITALLGLIVAGLSFSAPLAASITTLNHWMFHSVGMVYGWFATACLLVFVGLGLSPLGKLRLGGHTAQKEFNTFSWFAMLFAAGMGTGLMFWGATEPLYHFIHPPLGIGILGTETLGAGGESGITPGAPGPLQQALWFSFLHWGFHPWAIYGLTAACLGITCFNDGKRLSFSSIPCFEKKTLDPSTESSMSTTKRPWHQSLSVSSALLWARWGKTLVEAVTLLSIVVGVACTFGMGILQLEGGVKQLFGVEPNGLYRLVGVAGITLCYVWASRSGLKNGIRIVSNLSMGVAFLLLGSIFWKNGSALTHQWVEFAGSLPEFFKQLIPLGLTWAPYEMEDWPREWTLKYWSWWIAWAPFVGVFIALISKGRTLRELVLGIMILPTLFCWLWFSAYGLSAIQQFELGRLLPSGTLGLEQANEVLFLLFKALELPDWLCIVTLGYIALQFIDSADSATYTLATMSQPFLKKPTEGSENPEPSQGLILSWGLFISVLSSVFIMAGGIRLLQEMTLIVVFPFTVWLLFLFTMFVVTMVQKHFSQE
jgi:glycine betaine transporter